MNGQKEELKKAPKAKKPFSKKQKWLRGGMTFISIALIGAGAYMAVTILSPTVPILSGRAPDETARKLKDQPGTHGNRLFIPQINVDVAIVEGTSDAALEKGAWHRQPQNGNPEKGGNFVLSAHRFIMSFTPQGTAVSSPFYNIDKLKDGDILSVDYDNKRYEYKVEKKYSVKPTDVYIEGPSETPKLTLYSCTLQGSDDGRDVIEALPVTATADDKHAKAT
jgi:sortase A